MSMGIRWLGRGIHENTSQIKLHEVSTQNAGILHTVLVQVLSSILGSL